MRKMFVKICRIISAALLCFASLAAASGQDKKSSEPMVIGGSVGVDGAYCESAKADFDHIAQLADEKGSNVIIIARLGRGEAARSINRLRLSQLRDWLLNVREYSPDRVVTAEGERLRGLGQVEVYISGRPFIIYRMRRNRDFFRGNYGC